MEGPVTRCERCGAVSDLAAGFARRLTLAGRRTLCAGCPQRRRGFGLPLLLLALAGPFLLLLASLARMGRLDVFWYNPGWLLATTADYYRFVASGVLSEAHLLVAAAAVIIVVHEGGHFLAARLLGEEVPEVSLGLGPVVTRVRVGGSRLVVRLLPLVGQTLILSTGNASSRARRAVAVAAGPLAHAGVVVTAWAAGTSAAFPRHLAGLGAVTLVLNLVPHRAGGQATDGLQLVELLRGPESAPDGVRPLAGPAYARAVACHLERDLEAAQRWCEQGLTAEPDDTATEALLIAILIERDLLDEARRRAHALLGRDLPAVRRAITQCNLAHADLLVGDPTLVPEAAEAVARAHATLPWEPAVQATRAHVAITLGHLEEGLALASQALAAERDPAQRAGMLALRAIGHSRQGRFRAAESDLRQARRLNPDDTLIPRAVTEIERCRRVAGEPVEG